MALYAARRRYFADIRSWQTIVFDERQPVTFIRIVGTHNTANEVRPFS